MKYDGGETEMATEDDEKFLRYVLSNLTEIRDALLSDCCSRDQTYKACFKLGSLMTTIDLNLQNDW